MILTKIFVVISLSSIFNLPLDVTISRSLYILINPATTMKLLPTLFFIFVAIALPSLSLGIGNEAKQLNQYIQDYRDFQDANDNIIEI